MSQMAQRVTKKETILQNMIQAYKVLTGKKMVPYQTWFKMCEAMDERTGTWLRGRLYNVERMKGSLNRQKTF